MTGHACPCGSGRTYPECCGPFVSGEALAPTAEALMRSRFSAFASGNSEHIERSWAAETRPPTGAAEPVEWLGLEVLATSRGGIGDNAGSVEFAARYRSGRGIFEHREISNFRREGAAWVYVDGEVVSDTASLTPGKTGRNAPCPCGSGKKFKKCCGA